MARTCDEEEMETRHESVQSELSGRRGRPKTTWKDTKGHYNNYGWNADEVMDRKIINPR